MAGDTFSTYYGEFLISPIPLELSFNYCSHSCQYCFANLNKPERKANIQGTLNLLKDRYKRKSFEAYLLREGYPVLVSNRVDPFAVSNYRQVLPVLRLMTDLDIPIAFQTKGGRGVDEALEFLKPACWYISIASMSEEHRKQMEPGAPSIESRLDLIEKLVKAGHSVSVGINPCVEAWLGDPDPLLKAIAWRGAHGVWIEPLHLNSKQVGNMPEKGRALFSDELVATASKRLCPPTYVDYLTHVKQRAAAFGLEVFCVDHPQRSDYWAPYRELYPRGFPTHQEFINHLVDSGTPDNSLITLDQYLEFMVPQLPEGELRIGHYVGSTAHNVCREQENWNNMMTYEALLIMLWSDARIKMSPQRNHAFSRASDRAHNGALVDRIDESGCPILIFSTEGFDHYQVEV